MSAYSSEAFFAYTLLTHAALVSPVENMKLGLATREAHATTRHVLEEFVVKKQVVKLSLGEHISDVAKLLERE